LSGSYDIVVASGVESMSRIPIGSQAAGKDPFGPSVAKRYPEGLVPQGISAELIASKWKLSREQLDQFAVDSHRKASEAWSSGKFDREVLPLVLPGSEGATVTVTHDESVRPERRLMSSLAFGPRSSPTRGSTGFQKSTGG
jgi:acetyl-CoA acyltransferase